MAATSEKEKEACFGALYGAFCGDAAGSILEFSSHTPTLSEVKHAMTLPGGGQHFGSLAQGQITDDSEMAICLMRALSASLTDLNIESIVKNYIEWVNSPPFDIGNTTSNALGDPTKDAKTARLAAENKNQKSESNGCLMRIMPMIIWARKLPDAEFTDVILEDVMLTHSNKNAQDAVLTYSMAVRHLLNNLGDITGAYNTAERYARAKSPVMAFWIQEAKSLTRIDAETNMGWVKIPFTLAFRKLYQKKSYTEAIQETLLQGGDTDTNACIVGGMIGASVGQKGIPALMIERMLSADPSEGPGIPRPKWLIPRYNQKEIEEIVNSPVLGILRCVGCSEKYKKAYPGQTSMHIVSTPVFCGITSINKEETKSPKENVTYLFVYYSLCRDWRLRRMKEREKIV